MRNTYTTNVHTILLMILIVIIQYDIDDAVIVTGKQIGRAHV